MNEEKLREEIRQLQIANDRSDSSVGWILLWAPFVTVLVGVGTLLIAFFKQTNDMKQGRETMAADRDKDREQNEQWHQEFLRQNDADRAQREKDREQHEQWQADFLRQAEFDRAQREQESLRRFDSNLAQIITNLGAQSKTLRVNAAASIAMYMQPRYFMFHSELMTVLVANLRLGPDQQVADLLRADLERVLRLIAGNKAYRTEAHGPEIDLSRIDLRRLSLSNVDLDGIIVDLAYSDLTKANLRGTNLRRGRGIEVVLAGAQCSGVNLNEARLNKAHGQGAIFHNANLVSATMKDADLARAQFQGARLQGGQFGNADFSGANFTMANVADAFFAGCTFDDASLRTLVHAIKWKRAHFDPAVWAQLTALSEAPVQ